MKNYLELYVSPLGNDGGEGSKASPFATIERAYKAVSDTDSDVRVNFAEGVYPIKETLLFTPELCGDREIVFSGDKAEFFGGVKVTGWEKHTGGIYKASLDLPDVRNLYVNTFPAQRARSKYKYNIDDLYTKGEEPCGILVGEKNFPKSFYKWQDVEIVNNYEWESHRYRIIDYKYLPESHQYAFELDLSSAYLRRLGSFTKSFYLENDLSFLKNQGDFYYDKAEKTIYYYPYDNEDMSTALTYVGGKEMFVHILGTSEKKAGNITFEGIRFSGGACNVLSQKGYRCRQSDAIDSQFPELTGETPEEGYFGINTSQFRMNFAENVVVRNCEFINMGSAVMAMHDSVSNVLIEGNIFRDSSAVALRIGNADHKVKREGKEVCSNVTIKNNVITRMCGELYNNCGISIYYEKDIKIINNLITDLPYTGVSVSWGWNGAPGYDCRNIEVANNHIRRVMGILNDGGCVYTLCGVKGGYIHDNFFEDSRDRGLYNDAGSAHINSYNNVIVGCKYFIQVQELKYSTKDIKVYNNFSDTLRTLGPKDKGGVEVKRPFIVDRNDLPREAQDIVEKAGPQGEYKALEERALMPEWHRSRINERVTASFVSKSDAQIAKLKRIIEAEDFMEGGEGVGYHKTLKPIKNNNPYRPDEVRMYFNPAVASYVIQMDEPGEWLNYRYDVPETDEYYIDMITRPAKGEGILAKWYMDGEFLTDVPIVANEPEYTTVTVGPFPMEKGEHLFKMEFALAFYFDKFRIYTGKEPPVPQELYYTTDEDFDE